MTAKLNIPHPRLFLYLLILGFLPIFWAVGHVMNTHKAVREVHNSVEEVKTSALLLEKQQAKNRAIIEKFQEADHFYIDKHLEAMKFLKPEVEALQKRLDQTTTANNEAVYRRLEQLQKNKMAFVEGTVQTTPFYQETTETLTLPVEINIMDLQEILAKIEQVNLGPYEPAPQSPQLMVLNFRITKKQTTQNNEVFVLNLKLLKREFL